MRILKATSNYLWRQAAKRLALGIVFFTIFIVLFITSIDILPFYIDFGRYETSRGLIMGALLTGYVYVMYLSRNYRSGLIGEKKVVEILDATLSSEYSLFNDVTLRNIKKGNIDHVVVGPTGVFAIETKNNKGRISYYGDTWEGIEGQPSVQARINAVRIRDILMNSERFRRRTLFVQAVVVFSNKGARLIQKKPPDRVKVVGIDGLASLLTNEPRTLSAQDIESIEITIGNNITNND